MLGSRSTQMRGAFGGHDGRPLQVGDVLRRLGAGDRSGRRLRAGAAALALPLDRTASPACACCRRRSTSLQPAAPAAFWAEPWKITAQSDRYGYRLSGEALGFTRPLEMLSHGIVPGVIQVPPGGQPIIQMSDAQPSGGYPKFGTVIEADLWRLGQAPAGQPHPLPRDRLGRGLGRATALRAWLDEADAPCAWCRWPGGRAMSAGRAGACRRAGGLLDGTGITVLT